MPSSVTDIEGGWKIVDYPKHPECINFQINIKGYGFDPNMFKIYIHLINDLSCVLQHNAKDHLWKISNFFSTKLTGPQEQMNKENDLKNFMSSVQKLAVHNEKELIMKTNSHEQIRLERLP
ncbi:unnamed protein product [Adineta steineri]|uniref:Uncharacterized protein n=1 Tax=Adineta steineri TaxID=433720 RepID=A0A813YSN9_9BILA|nr:unnamed protein product [Adineta steineri]CAF3873454.1 unnamed protein product [Adineta steineri]